MTFIALEGCDGAGKSTLAEAIQAELEDLFPDESIMYIHRSQLKRDPLDEYALDIEDYRPGEGKHVIADRWHWGETIYGPLYRGESSLTVPGFRWTELFMKARGAVLWHVTAALETIENRLRVRGEDYLESHHVRHVWEGFEGVADLSMLTGGHAVTDRYDPEVLANRVVQSALYYEEQAQGVFRPEYIGRDMPNALLVGDIQGNGEPGVTAAPFMPRGSSSGRFLLDALPEGWWREIGLVNANETDLPALWNSLYSPPVVALGKNASEALQAVGIEHGTVPHPQYVRRFHARKKESYGGLIRQVAQTGENKLSWPK